MKTAIKLKVTATAKTGQEVINLIKKIHQEHQNEVAKLPDGSILLIDAFSASAMSMVFDALSPQNQQDVINKMLATKSGLLRFQSFAMKQVSGARSLISTRSVTARPVSVKKNSVKDALDDYNQKMEVLIKKAQAVGYPYANDIVDHENEERSYNTLEQMIESWGNMGAPQKELYKKLHVGGKILVRGNGDKLGVINHKYGMYDFSPYDPQKPRSLHWQGTGLRDASLMDWLQTMGWTFVQFI